MKTRLKYEILIIVAFSTIAGLMYNAFVRDPKTRLPWLREQVVLSTVTDEDLFAPSPKSPDSVHSLTSSSDAPTKNIDVPVATNRTPPTKDSAQKKTAQNQNAVSQIPQTNEQQERKALAVTYQQVLRLHSDESVLFFDARNEHEFAEGTIPRSKNIFPLDFGKHIPYILGLPKDGIKRHGR